MKNKLEKRNMTKFDYNARKYGLIGCILVVFALAVMLPISASISSNNVNLTKEIRTLNNEMDNSDLVVIESK